LATWLDRGSASRDCPGEEDACRWLASHGPSPRSRLPLSSCGERGWEPLAKATIAPSLHPSPRSIHRGGERAIARRRGSEVRVDLTGKRSKNRRKRGTAYTSPKRKRVGLCKSGPAGTRPSRTRRGHARAQRPRATKTAESAGRPIPARRASEWVFARAALPGRVPRGGEYPRRLGSRWRSVGRRQQRGIETRRVGLVSSAPRSEGGDRRGDSERPNVDQPSLRAPRHGPASVVTSMDGTAWPDGPTVILKDLSVSGNTRRTNRVGRLGDLQEATFDSFDSFDFF
jgi:hypothetical protein